ncbi:MAG TPA: hypothetical protein VM925_29290 [Labilithrix sp.]|jgi:hypothetical protein|nr:hypothetical protein [Labilithrix sp.]
MTEALTDLSFTEGALSIEAVYDGTVIRLTFVGEATITDPIATLESIFEAAHREALRRLVDAVLLDVKQLEYMNSSCFKAFISWIDLIRQLEPEQQYRLRFVSNPAVTWQGRTLKSLQRFAAELVRLD